MTPIWRMLGTHFLKVSGSSWTIARVFLSVPKILILMRRLPPLILDRSLGFRAFSKPHGGRTSFIIAHRLSTIQNADIILVMVDGDIVEHGITRSSWQPEATPNADGAGVRGELY